MLFHTIKASLIDGTDVWVNNSESYFLIIGIHTSYNPVSSGIGNGTALIASVGNVISPDGTVYGEVETYYYQSSVVAGSLSDEVFQGSFSKLLQTRIVPPHWTLNDFATAMGFYMDKKEIEQFILNGGK